MVIQRLQTLFLIVAAILMVLVNFVAPIAQVSADGVTETFRLVDVPALMVINLITAIILIVDIFLFKTLPLQMKLARISAVLIVVSVAYEVYVLTSIIDGTPMWITSMAMLVCAFIFTLLALNGMNKDYNTLRSYDRLR